MRIIFISLVLLAALAARAQHTVVTYTCQAPAIDLGGAKKIWVENFTVDQRVDWWLTMDRGIPEQIKNQITWSTRGGDVKNLYSPWLRTDWYVLANTAQEADVIISGTISATKTEVMDRTEESFQAPLSKKEEGRVPYVAYRYQYFRSINVKAHVTIKMKDGTVLKELDFDIDKVDQPAVTMGMPPAIMSWTKLKLAAMTDIYGGVGRAILPLLVKTTVYVGKYKFEDKELRKLYKSVDDLSDIQDMKVACSLFEQMVGEGDQMAANNAGVLHYLLGNYPEAEKYLKLGNYAKASELISEMKATKELFEKNKVAVFSSPIN